jgi:pyrimidine-nucleoside phosphorylase
MTAILTDMDEPLGCGIGNQLEVIEAINTLKGNGPKDLTDICLEIGSYLVLDAKVTDSLEEAKKQVEKYIELDDLNNSDVIKSYPVSIEDNNGNIIEDLV